MAKAKAGKGKMQSISVKPQKDSMSKNVKDHMGGSYKAGKGGKASVTGGKSK